MADSFRCQRFGCGSPKATETSVSAMKEEKFPLEEWKRAFKDLFTSTFATVAQFHGLSFISCWPQYIVTSHSFTDEHRRE